MQTKSIGNFKKLESIFLEKNPNGKLTKINGGVNVIYNISNDRCGYDYKGTLTQNANKLNLEVAENEIIIKDKLTDIKKEGIVKIDWLELGYQSQWNQEVKYSVSNGEVTLYTSDSLSHCNSLKLYENKKGLYFTFEKKRFYI